MDWISSIKVLLLCGCLGVPCFGALSSHGTKYPEGYYAFAQATSLYDRPPRVRKPPYVPSNVPCPGQLAGERFSPRDTLCGDLNRGFLPKNPTGQEPLGQPYPLDLIKNKTLQFLAKVLPILKKDPNVPKVARFVGAPVEYRETGGYDVHQEQEVFRERRDLDLEDYANATNETDTTEMPMNLTNVEEVVSTARKMCAEGSSMWCTILKTFTDGRLPAAILTVIADMLIGSSQAPLVQSAHSNNSPLGIISNILQGLAPVTTTTTTTPAPLAASMSGNNNSPWLQALSLLTGVAAASSIVQPDNSPLQTIVDLVTNENSPIAGVFYNLFSSNKRRPASEKNDIDGTYPPPGSSGLQDGLPPTPCPSIEEYVTPVFARNYQGVWKYVVQIPHEGYFTQTVQRTSCVKSNCDFMEGICHESPRWVSLLVAEIFYPNMYFPTTSPPPPVTQTDPYNNEVPPVEDFHSFQQYLRRRVGEQDAANNYHHQKQGTAIKGSVNHRGNHYVRRENCDGYDKTGCFIVRVYYDWFLVNGSCKCWRPSARSLFMSQTDVPKH